MSAFVVVMRRHCTPQPVILSGVDPFACRWINGVEYPFSATAVFRVCTERYERTARKGILRLRDCFACGEAITSLRMTGCERLLTDVSVFARARYYCQRLLEVCDQVVGIFDSYRQTDQLIGYSHRLRDARLRSCRAT